MFEIISRRGTKTLQMEGVVLDTFPSVSMAQSTLRNFGLDGDEEVQVTYPNGTRQTTKMRYL
jgi:hypothetical protein